MQRPSRRAVLGALAGIPAAIAGCTGGQGGTGSGDAAPTDADGGGGADTTLASDSSQDAGASGGGESDALRLESLAVGGSPGGPLTVDPRGSPVLLDFFATWCAPCKPQMEHLRTIDQEYDDLRLRSVTRERDQDAITSFWREYEGTWPVAMDPKLLAFEAFGVTRVPVLVVVDAQGAEVWRHAGLASADSIREAVDEARG